MARFLAYFWLIFIAVLHALPGSEVPSNHIFNVFHLDKLVHAFIFFVAYVILVYSHHRQYSHLNTRLVFIGLILYGLLLELGQAFIFIERNFSVLDLVADSIGVLLGIYFFTKIPFLSTFESCKKV